MSAAGYTPREGTKPAAIMAYFQANPGAALDNAAMQREFDLALNNVPGTVKTLMEVGLIERSRERIDGKMVTLWRAGSGEQHNDADVQPGEFCGALDTDGELYLRGANVLDAAAGEVLLNAAQTAKLFALFNRTRTAA